MMTQAERLGLQQVKWLTKNISAISSWSTEAPRVAAYLRSAVENEEYTAAQLAEIRQYLEDRGGVLACIYSDNGYSGNSDQRPALSWLRHAIQNERVEVVVVCDLARLFRDLSGLWRFMRLLQEYQVGLVCL